MRENSGLNEHAECQYLVIVVFEIVNEEEFAQGKDIEWAENGLLEDANI